MGAQMHISEIKLFQILKGKIGEDEAQTLVEFIDTKVEKEFEHNKDFLATKKDLSELRDELKADNLATKKEISDLRVEQKRDKADIIKWMFIFWIGTIGSLIAIMKLL
jgi:hypothetical protein